MNRKQLKFLLLTLSGIYIAGGAAAQSGWRSPGKVGQDGDGRNSPYTKNLVRAMQQPNKPIEQVFKEARRAVQAETKNQQTPWENTSLSGDFYFRVQK
jgi:uncharacterized caspase-like protein